jgi:hypothetical protein
MDGMKGGRKMGAKVFKTGARLNVERLEELQKKHGLKFDTDLAEKIGIGYTTLWRIKLPADDPRYSAPGKDSIAKILKAFPEATFEELFFLDECCEGGTKIEE